MGPHYGPSDSGGVRSIGPCGPPSCIWYIIEIYLGPDKDPIQH